MLDPEVVTPNAAKATGRHANKKPSENLIVTEEYADSSLCPRQAHFYMLDVPKFRDIASGFSSGRPDNRKNWNCWRGHDIGQENLSGPPFIAAE